MDRAVDPTASLSRLERSLLSVSKRRGTAPFIAAVAAISIALSVAFTSLAMMALRADRQDFIVALVISVAVPAVVAPAAASMLGRLLLAIDAASVELRHLARIDGLTGTLNRRAFAAEAEGMIVRRGAETLVVAMVDLDDFKGVNDRFGHGCGDSVLIELADALHGAVGGDGIVGRFGGDEFVALLLVPGDAAEAVARLDATLDLDHVVQRGHGVDRPDRHRRARRAGRGDGPCRPRPVPGQARPRRDRRVDVGITCPSPICRRRPAIIQASGVRTGCPPGVAR